MRGLVCLLSACALLSACGGGNPAGPTGSGNVTISVRGDGQPVVGAAVALRTDMAPQMTDGSGKVVFQGVPFGSHAATVQAFGYAMLVQPFSVQSPAIDVSATLVPHDDVILDQIIDDAQGPLASGATVKLPTTLRFRGRVRLISLSRAGLGVSLYASGVNVGARGGGVDVTSSGAWEVVAPVTSAPCFTDLSTGVTTCFDKTDQVIVTMGVTNQLLADASTSFVLNFAR